MLTLDCIFIVLHCTVNFVFQANEESYKSMSSMPSIASCTSIASDEEADAVSDGLWKLI